MNRGLSERPQHRNAEWQAEEKKKKVEAARKKAEQEAAWKKEAEILAKEPDDRPPYLMCANSFNDRSF